MKALARARELLCAAAQAALSIPEDQVAPAEKGLESLAELGGLLVAEAEASGAQSLAWLRAAGLLQLDSWLVLACAATEVFPEAAAAASLLAEDERVHLVTAASWARIATTVFGVSYTQALRSAMGGGAALRLGLLETVEAVSGRPGSQRGLRIRLDDLEALLAGRLSLRPRALSVERVSSTGAPAYPVPLVAGVERLVHDRRMVVLRAQQPRAAVQLALDLSSIRKSEVVVIRTGVMPSSEDLARLRGELVFLDLSECERVDVRHLRVLEESCEALLFLSDGAYSADLASVDVPRLGYAQALAIWKDVLDDDTSVRSLARRFRLDSREVAMAVCEARNAATVRDRAVTRELIVDRVLARGARRMGPLVSAVHSDARLDDLSVPDELRGQLVDLVRWYRASTRAWWEMGLRAPGGEGKGLTALFSGKPGTGKTFAAKCVANELGLNLYRIDLSKVVSKYIGETEKALRRVFDEAEAGHGVLLFDEADALFGKRSEVRDAHDRYANIEVGYLLQRLEVFDGVTILTTNLRANLDQAFLRRFRFLLEFPMPSRDQRAKLWERSLPASIYRDDELPIDEFVERFRLSGGDIYNIGVAATHLAAATEAGIVTAGHLVQATYRELEKSGRAREAADFGPLAHLLEVGERQ